MNGEQSIEQRVERALRLLDWLAAEAPALDRVHVALRLDEIRNALLAIDTRGFEAEEETALARADAPEDAGASAHATPDPGPIRHWVLLALPQRGLGAPLGCYPTPDTAKAAAEAWSGSPLDWRWMDASPEFGFPWNRASWHSGALITRPDDLLDDDSVDLYIYPMRDGGLSTCG